ncbi:hypothetical protein R6Q59_027126 [Mikania micrantha]
MAEHNQPEIHQRIWGFDEDDEQKHDRIWEKKFGPFLDLCVSSLRRGHANLLCIVPILSDVPEGTIINSEHQFLK